MVDPTALNDSLNMNLKKDKDGKEIPAPYVIFLLRNDKLGEKYRYLSLREIQDNIILSLPVSGNAERAKELKTNFSHIIFSDENLIRLQLPTDANLIRLKLPYDTKEAGNIFSKIANVYQMPEELSLILKRDLTTYISIKPFESKAQTKKA